MTFDSPATTVAASDPLHLATGATHHPATGATHHSAPGASRITRRRYELRRRRLQVLDVDRLGPGFVGVTLGGADLAGFESASFDDHVKLLFEQPDGSVAKRDYTPRRVDAAAGTLRLEFALHEAGPAADWARQVTPGQSLVVAGPKGSMIVPPDWDWQWLIGDAAALPAILRRLEELPAGTAVTALVQVDDPADRRAIATAAQAEVLWFDDAASLLAALRARPLPAGEGFVWAGGEAATMAQVRDRVVVQAGHPREATRISAYWKRGAAEFHERLDAA